MLLAEASGKTLTHLAGLPNWRPAAVPVFGGASLRPRAAVLMRRAVAAALLLSTAGGLGGCLPPGTGTAIEKGVAEARGGRGEVQVVRSLPAGRVLDRFRSVRVLPVERSPDAGPIPSTLPAVLGSELLRGLREAHVFLGGGGPTLILHVRLTTHWPADGALQAVSAYSEILARVEFREEGQPTPLGIYYVRGYSTAIKRKADEDLSQGVMAAVLGVIQQHHGPLPPRTVPP